MYYTQFVWTPVISRRDCPALPVLPAPAGRGSARGSLGRPGRSRAWAGDGEQPGSGQPRPSARRAGGQGLLPALFITEHH